MNRALRCLTVIILPVFCLTGCSSTGTHSILNRAPIRPSGNYSQPAEKTSGLTAAATRPSLEELEEVRIPTQSSTKYSRPSSSSELTTPSSVKKPGQDRTSSELSSNDRRPKGVHSEADQSPSSVKEPEQDLASIPTLPKYNQAKTDSEIRRDTPFSFTDTDDRIAIQESRKLLPRQKQNYLIGPDDILEVSVFEWDLTDETRILELRVSKTGVIALPSLGSVKVAGLSVEDVNANIVNQLSDQNILQNARVSVSVKEYRHRRVAVLGAVNLPGMYALQENAASLLEVLSLAGGPSADASAVAYVQQMPDDDTQEDSIVIDLDQLFKFGQSDLNPLLRGGDSVYIPPSPLVYIYGRVKNPGAISLRRPTTVLEAIALSGGFAEKANREWIRLIRKHDNGTEETLLLNFRRIEKGLDPDFYLQQNDLLRVQTANSKQLAYGLWEVFTRIFAFSYRLD